MAHLTSSALLLLSLILTHCGAGYDVFLSKAREGVVVGPGAEKLFFKETFKTTTGTDINLNEIKDKPIVLVFATETCSTCIEEAELFRDGLKDPKLSPDKVHLVTVITGSFEEDAIEWQRRLKVPWTVAYIFDTDAFKFYCGGKTTPCTLVQTPDEGIIYKHIGLSTRDKLEPITGPWE